MKQRRQLYTYFSEGISEDTVLSEYPRPTLVRSSYLNLNGIWQYAITGHSNPPLSFDGDILVPFSPECALSRVQRRLEPTEFLWYRRTLSVVRPQPGKRLILHFGAVDQYAQVYVNRIQAGSHLGGYLPFSMDITDFIQSGENELLVKVWDRSDTSYHSRGKQSLKPGGMFYTAQSGIWQTVWAEIVPDHYIEHIFFFPDYDRRALRMKIITRLDAPLTCTIYAEGCAPTTVETRTNEEVEIALETFHPWSPEDPFLYQVSLKTGQDTVRSYFALRKCEISTDQKGVRRFFLNGRPYFQAGVLDQGYWPESLYTAPTDEALVFDIQKMKELGFNMLRKHAKIEPERFYYHCDRLGMLVWQDLVNGGTSYQHWFVTYLATLMNCRHISFHDGEAHRKLLSRTEEAGRREFVDEIGETISFLYNHPCIVVWVPFNEGWGQFDACAAADYIRRLDPQRLIDHASGWFDQKGGDILSLHYYFFTLRFSPELLRVAALTEFGGYSLSLKEHAACNKVYGYRKFKTAEALTAAYRALFEQTVLPAVRAGIGATIYTQLSDIEEETNGLYTYDRKVLKPDAQTVRELNEALKEIVR